MASQQTPPSNRSVPEVRIVVAYLVLASLWIVGSDLLLSKSPVDEDAAFIIQSLKGLNFVITTAVLLFFVLRRSYGGWRRAEQKRLAEMEQNHERLQLLTRNVQTLREQDRTFIAREIHDELGQLLTGIKMHLRLAEDRLSDRDDRSLNPVIDRLVEAASLVDTTITSVQRISAGLRPSALDDLGLGTALVQEGARFSQLTDIPCKVEVEDFPEEDIPPEVATTVFRIFQEAVTNVARHADARHVDTTLTSDDQQLTLTVRDDGKGLDPEEVGKPTSLGLIGMFERAENVGGHVSIRRNPKAGTDVVLKIPLAPGAKPSKSSPDPLHEYESADRR